MPRKTRIRTKCYRQVFCFIRTISTAGGKQEGSIREYVWIPQRYRQCLALRIAFFWAITQRVVVISYRRFGTTYRYHFQCPSKVGPIGCSETSVTNYHYSLRNNPEEHIFHLLRGGNVKSRILPCLYLLLIYLTTPSVATKIVQCQVLGRVVSQVDEGTL